MQTKLKRGDVVEVCDDEHLSPGWKGTIGIIVGENTTGMTWPFRMAIIYTDCVGLVSSPETIPVCPIKDKLRLICHADD